MKRINKYVALAGVAALVASSGLTGCTRMTAKETHDRTAGRVMDDKNVTAKIEKDLKNEPVFKFPDVEVKTYAGVVQLSGFVATEDQKRRAGEIAQNTPGVSKVVNNISLKPQPPTTPTGRTVPMGATTNAPQSQVPPEK
jgi:hyperosmotically inducible protein